MSKHMTMAQIARRANVSITTVSRVLSGNGCVAEATRQRIQLLIDQYQFKPNTAARTLAKKQSNMLGVLVQNIENPYFAAMYMQAENTANSLGYSSMLFNSPMDEDELSAIVNMVQLQVAGMILSTVSVDSLLHGNPFISKLEKYMSPKQVVLLNDPPDDYEGPWVYVSGANKEAYAMATRYLISLGHRQIAFVGGNRQLNLAFQRMRAFQEEMKNAGCEVRPEFIQMSGYDIEDGEEGMLRILGMGVFPTAVLAVSDLVAMGVLRVCMRQGIRIPGDMSIISCDNTFIARGLSPALTSIDINPARQGDLAARLLVKMIAGEDVPPLNEVLPRLIIRESTACPCI